MVQYRHGNTEYEKRNTDPERVSSGLDLGNKVDATHILAYDYEIGFADGILLVTPARRHFRMSNETDIFR